MQGAPPLDTQALTTPYLEGLKHHETLFGDLATRARHWRLLALGLLVILGIVSIDNLIGRLNVRTLVYVAEVWPDGTKLRVTPLGATYRPKEEYKKGQVRIFVRFMRERIKDPRVTSQRWQELRTLVTPAGHAKLTQAYGENNPVTYKGSIEVQVDSVLPLSETAYQVRWAETSYSEHNARLETKRYIGSFVLVIRPPTTQAEAESNPLGILVDGWNISQEG